MKREARIMLGKSIDSLALSIEHFNRPCDRGRKEAVLVFLDRGFELLLKATVVHRGGRIRERRAKETISLDKCVRKCLSDKQLKCLTDDQALTVRIINGMRDAAQHHILDISEQQLYMYSQAGVTTFDEILRDVFAVKLSDKLPQRVLPVCTSPPRDLHSMIETEFQDIKSLLTLNSRKQLEARAKLRGLAIIEASLQGIRSQPSDYELRKLIRQVQKDRSWQDLFPGVASLRLDTDGTGLTVSIRLTKGEGDPVRLVKEDAPEATVVAVKRVNELSYYSLGLKALSEKLGITQPKTLALVKHLRIQESDDYFKTFWLGTTQFKRYSLKALQILREALPAADMNSIWRTHRPRPKLAK
ncbi:MAG: hypothetical protein DDT33_01317 [Firmicutes bacterium]|nr:hypothetical protein [Bacillota bacterium]